MAGVPNTVVFQGTRRIRVFFTQALAAAAFTSLGYYSVTNTDGLGTSPIAVQAAYAVLGSTNAVELAVDSDLVPGASYNAVFAAVPFADTTTFTGTISAALGLNVSASSNAEPAVDDLSLLVYGRDWQFADTGDFASTGGGDIATIVGQPNWQGAITRRLTSYGLLWAPSYSPRANAFVNAPDAYQQPFAASLVAQARADDRTRTSTAQPTSNLGGVSGAYGFLVTMTGKDKLQPITVSVPMPSAT